MRSLVVLTAILLAVGSTQPVRADGDVAKGEKIFKKCKACHAVGEGSKNRVGPVLNGIVGAAAASVADFEYSQAFLAKKQEGLVWSEQNLTAYLENPKDFINGTKMVFAGLKKPQERADLIAHLKTVK